MKRIKIAVSEDIIYTWLCAVCQQINKRLFSSSKKHPEELVCSTCGSKIKFAGTGTGDVWWYYFNDKEIKIDHR